MTSRFDDRAPPARFTLLAGALLWLAMLSATLAETDAYRIAGIIAALSGLVMMITVEPRYRMSALGWLSIGWGVYALVRFGWIYLSTTPHARGSSEWLYAFPLFFPGLGMALSRMRFHVRQVLAVFFAVALVALLLTLDWPAILAGAAAPPLRHNNQIHAAVACGMIAIGAFYFMLDALSGQRRDLAGRLAVLLGPPVILLCLVGIYAAKSKGVWLAMAMTAPLMGLSAFFLLPRRVAAPVALLLFLLLAMLVLVFHQNLWATAGSNVMAGWHLLVGLSGAPDKDAYIRALIESGSNPQTLNERLEMWYNAYELFRQAPLFGHGNRWFDLWGQTRYGDVGYTLMHNGYAEIAIRHGLFGFAVFAVMLAGFFRLAIRAARAGLISRPALFGYGVLIVYFAATLITNSNNRLAIGESLAMLSGAVAFCCERLLRLKAETEGR